MNAQALNQQFPLPGLSHWSIGQNNFPFAYIENRYGTAKISLYGGHLLAWQPSHSQPVVWQSEQNYQEGEAIWGGIPIIFPWFGAHPTDESQPIHGEVRTRWWTPCAVGSLPNGATFFQMCFDNSTFQLNVTYTIGWTLTTTLTVTNTSNQPLPFTSALHTYFAVGNVCKTTICGLNDGWYQDAVAGGLHKQEGVVKFGNEVDRIYVDTAAPIIIHDPVFGRKITISKRNSRTTVVWNPSTTALNVDLQEGEWEQFVCVEAVKCGRDAVTLQPSQQHIYSQTVTVSG